MPIKVLVIRAGQLGDTVCASSIIAPLRHQFGHDTIIDWVGKTSITRVFAQDPRIHRIFEVKSRNLPLLFNRDKLRIILHALHEPYDYIINLELGTIFNGVMRFCRAKNKIGMPYDYFQEPKETHAVENLILIYKSFLDKSVIPMAVPTLIGTPPDQIRQKFSLDDDYFLAVPANSHMQKTNSINHRAWPLSYWCRLFALLQSKRVQVVIIGGKAEANIFTGVCTLPDNILDLTGRTNFPELVGLIQGAKAVITTDTGPSHIASAVNTPVYALIGPTNFKRTGPYKTANNEVHILSANIHCSPCYHSERHRLCTDNQCMQQVLPEQVFASLLDNSSHRKQIPVKQT